ncbi:hypothetical protein R1flu_014496 [Riccia fluitans]|uniref:HNH homing endonuclease n=1 Tax=Riccia fluitans TaxID=41844 RepID=A0ABD1YGL6_9MARC
MFTWFLQVLGHNRSTRRRGTPALTESAQHKRIEQGKAEATNRTLEWLLPTRHKLARIKSSPNSEQHPPRGNEVQKKGKSRKRWNADGTMIAAIIYNQKRPQSKKTKTAGKRVSLDRDLVPPHGFRRRRTSSSNRHWRPMKEKIREHVEVSKNHKMQFRKSDRKNWIERYRRHA